MPKQITYGENARKEIFVWIEMVAKAVMVTMWPKWQNVILDRWYGSPVFTNDGVTVAKEIELEDKYHNVWASIIKEAAERTNKLAGDWTTTTTVLTYAIAKEGLRYIKTWVNPFSLSRWLHKAVDWLIQELKTKATPIHGSRESIQNIATISAQDPDVWHLIADILAEIGQDGVITVEEWRSMWLDKEVVIWMQFDQGYGSPYFVTDPQKMEAVIEKAKILITDKKISSIKDIIGILESAAATGTKNFVIIADDIEWEALANLVLNKMRWILNVITIKAPWFGDRKKEILRDIAVVTWATVITEELWITLENASVDMLWSAEKVVASKDTTTIIGWKWSQDEINDRIMELKAQIANSNSDYDREKMVERLAKLAWWIAVIRVWAATEMEMKSKKWKIEDALNATSAAIEEWIVAWGWVTLINIAHILNDVKLEDADEQIWVDIVKEAIQYPIKQIANNAGYKWDRVVEKIKENKELNYGFDAKTGQFKDMLTDGIIDPAKVIRVSLENAVSAAAMFLTTDAVIVDIASKEQTDMSGAMGWMWWMGWMPMM